MTANSYKRLDVNDSSQLAHWLLILTLSGYPLVALFSTLFNVEHQLLSISFRLVVLILAFGIFIRFSIYGHTNRIHLFLKLLLSIYLLRLIWDASFTDLPETSHALIFFVGTCLLPSLAIGKAGISALGEFKVAKHLLLLGTVVGGSAIGMQLLGLGSEKSLLDITNRLSFEALNPISLGHLAVTTIICILWLSANQGWTFRKIIFWCVALEISLFCLVLTASNGPLVALALCMVWLLFNKPGKSKYLMILSIVSLSILMNPKIGSIIKSEMVNNSNVVVTSEAGGNSAIARFENGASQESLEERLKLQKNALAIFLHSPIVGGAYIDPETLEYPHNLFIETAMALGFVGLIFLVVILVATILKIHFGKPDKRSLIAMLFLQYLIAFQFSGALWGFAQFWVLLALITSRQQYGQRYVQPNSGLVRSVSQS